MSQNLLNNEITGRYYLEVYNNSNAGWRNKSNIDNNSTTSIAPFPYIEFNVSNEDTLNVSISPQLCNSTNGPTVNEFYYYISDGRDVKPDTYTGPFIMGTPVGISNTTDFYNQYGCNITFHVAVSNALYTSLDLTEQTCNVYTGPQCNVDKPTILDFSVVINNTSGVVTTSGTVSNIQGLLTYYLTYSNIYTTNVLTVYPPNCNTAGDFSFDYSNAGFLELFSNVVTIYASNTSNPYWISDGSNVSGTTAGYRLLQPSLDPIVFTNNNNGTYTLTTTTPSYLNNSYDTRPEIRTIWTLGCNSIGILGSITNITPSITLANNSNFIYNNALPDTYYFVGGRFQASNEYNVFNGPTCNVTGIRNMAGATLTGTTQIGLSYQWVAIRDGIDEITATNISTQEGTYIHLDIPANAYITSYSATAPNGGYWDESGTGTLSDMSGIYAINFAGGNWGATKYLSYIITWTT